MATSEDQGGSRGQSREVFHPHSFVSLEVVEDNRWRLKPENRSEVGRTHASDILYDTICREVPHKRERTVRRSFVS